MVCPRCDSARIEHCGASIRCAICGLSYDPKSVPKVPTQTIRIPLLDDPQSLAFEAKRVA